MRQKFITGAKFIACLPVAWLGGNIIYGILASGTWVFSALYAFVPEAVVDALAIFFLWACRIGLFIVLLIGWVFEPKGAVMPQSK